MEDSKGQLPKAIQNKGSKIRKKPKRNISAYHIFSKEMHAMLNEAPEKVNPNKRMALISEKWSNLPPEEKYIYMEKAKLDKLRYLNELNYYYYSAPSAAAESTTIKHKPKKFGNAFTFFLRDKKEQLRQSQPHLSMSDIMSLVAKEWRGMSESEKQKYIDASEEDKKRYKREMSEVYESTKKTGSKSRKKKFIEDVQRFEKNADNSINDTRENLNLKTAKDRLEDATNKMSKQGKTLKFEKEREQNRSTRLPSLEMEPKLDMTNSPKALPAHLHSANRENSFENSTLPKLESGELTAQNPPPSENVNNAFSKDNFYQRGDSFDLFNFAPRNSQMNYQNLDPLPRLSSFNSLTFGPGNINNDANNNIPNASNSEDQKDKGRDYLNGALANALNAVGPLFPTNDLFGDSHSFNTTQKSTHNDFKDNHYQ